LAESALMVGRTPWSAADALVGLLAPCKMLTSWFGLRDEGVPRGPGGPPHQSGAPHLPEARVLISMLLTTCFTPLTFLVTDSALDFRLFCSTEPASVTTPSF